LPSINSFPCEAFADEEIQAFGDYFSGNLPHFIIETSHKCGVKIVAEGIESNGEFDCMKQLGADYFQGYYLTMPE